MTIIAALTAFAPVLGAIAGLIPAFLQYMTLKANNVRYIELKKLELQAAEKGYTFQLDLAAANADIHQQDHIYNFANNPSGIRWVDALAIIVRPYITIVIFHLWALIKVAVFVAAVNGGLNLQQVIGVVWTDADTMMFGSVIGFWFGSRGGARGMQMMTATSPSAQSKITRSAPPDLGFIPKPAGSKD